MGLLAGGRVGAQELHPPLLGVEVAQSVGEELVGDVSVGVDDEAVVAEPAVLGRPRQQVRQVDAARRELLQDRDQAARLVVYQRADEPGSLISILQEFAARRINLSNLISRPTKNGGLGDYCFIIYADGHIADEIVADAIRQLRAKQATVKFLGSYPAAGEHAHSAREHADSRWREADDWINELRRKITPS